jgi:type I restriction enzyme S subunit
MTTTHELTNRTTKYYSGPEPEGYRLTEGDLIVTMTDLSKAGDTLGYPAFVPKGGPFLHNQRIGLVLVQDAARVDKHFLYYLLRTSDYRQHVLATATGSTVRHSSPSRILEYECLVPPVDEQLAIAGVLGALDDKIECNRMIASLAEQLAVAQLDRGVKHAPVGSLANIDRVQAKAQDFESIEVDHFSLPAFDAGRLPDRCAGRDIKSGKFKISQPVVLVSKLNPRIPRVWHAVPTPRITALASTEFVVLRPAAGLTSQELWAACATSAFAAALMDRVTGTTGSHQRVRPEDVLETPVVDLREVPDDTRVTVRALVDCVAATRIESVHLGRVRDALLPPLISGELHVAKAQSRVGEAV